MTMTVLVVMALTDPDRSGNIYNCFCFFFSRLVFCFLPLVLRWEGEPALLFTSSSSEKLLLSPSSAPSFSGSNMTACNKGELFGNKTRSLEAATVELQMYEMNYI